MISFILKQNIFTDIMDMISGAKVQKAVHACMIRLLNLGPAEHEEVAIYTVNQWIPNVRELREQLRCEAIRGYQVRGKTQRKWCKEPRSFFIHSKKWELRHKLYRCKCMKMEGCA